MSTYYCNCNRCHANFPRLKTYTVKILKEMGKVMGVTGMSSCNKSRLIMKLCVALHDRSQERINSIYRMFENRRTGLSKNRVLYVTPSLVKKRCVRLPKFQVFNKTESCFCGKTSGDVGGKQPCLNCGKQCHIDCLLVCNRRTEVHAKNAYCPACFLSPACLFSPKSKYYKMHYSFLGEYKTKMLTRPIIISKPASALNMPESSRTSFLLSETPNMLRQKGYRVLTMCTVMRGTITDAIVFNPLWPQEPLVLLNKTSGRVGMKEFSQIHNKSKVYDLTSSCVLGRNEVHFSMQSHQGGTSRFICTTHNNNNNNT